MCGVYWAVKRKGLHQASNSGFWSALRSKPYHKTAEERKQRKGVSVEVQDVPAGTILSSHALGNNTQERVTGSTTCQVPNSLVLSLENKITFCRPCPGKPDSRPWTLEPI